MTNKEALIITNILLTADGGCAYCAAALARQFVGAFPEIEEVVRQVWLEEFEDADDWKEG